MASPIITIRTIEADRQRLREEAAARGVTVADLVRQSVAAYAGVPIRSAHAR